MSRSSVASEHPIYIRGTGMTRFGRQLDRSMKDMGREATEAALKDAGVEVGDIDAVFFSNSLAGLITGQETIRGEVVLYPMGFGTIPIHNVENACASGGDALHMAWTSLAAGLHTTVLVLGVEKANHEDRQRTFSAYASGTDVEQGFEAGAGAGKDRTPLVDRQAGLAHGLMDQHGLTREGFARIASKAYGYGALNPLAHRQMGATPEAVLAARMVVDPITTMMSSPISDGAAAAVITLGPPATGDIRIAGSRLASRPPLGDPTGPSAVRSATRLVYEDSGIGPEELDFAEVHDASVAYEVISWTDAGLCAVDDAQEWAMSGHTALGGPFPVNTSGGLIARGHALGASGVAQIHEVVLQLRGQAGACQVPEARVALAQVGGGVIDGLTAVSSAHILVRD